MTRLLMRPFRKSMGAQLLAGFGIVTLFALLVAAISIASVLVVNQRLADLADADRQIATQINLSRLAFERQHSSLYSYLAGQHADDLSAYRLASFDARAGLGELRRLVTDEPQIAALDAVQDRHVVYEQLADSTFDVLIAGSPSAALTVWRDQGRPLRVELSSALNGLTRLHEEKTRIDLEEASRQSILIQFVSLGFIVGGALGAFLLGRRMTLRVTNRLEVLAAQADALRAGNLKARSPDLGHDELALLGAELNRMAADVEESHRRIAQALTATRRREEELRVLNSIASAIARSLDLDQVLQISLNQVCDLLAIDAADILLIDDHLGELWLAANRGFSDEIIRDFNRLRALELVAGAVATTGEPIVIDEISVDSAIGFGHVAREGYRTFASVPMTAKDRAVGVMNVATKQARRFTPAEITLLLAIGNQVALAVENARLYSQARTVGVAEERNRMAREIHDTLAQGLTGITLQLEWAEAVLNDDPAQSRQAINRALSIARDNLNDARRSVMDLRAAPLEGLTLSEALQRLVEDFGRDQEIEATFAANGALDRYSARVEAGVYRIAQEALSNVAKHACANQVSVELAHANGHIRLIVADDGVGFDPNSPRRGSETGGFGLVGLRERAALLGGEVVVASDPGCGARVTATIPTNESAPRST